MGIEDWGYRWLKRYMDAPQWIKEPLGRLYGLLPDRWRHGKDFARFRAEASLNDPAEIQRLTESRLRETLLWAIQTVPAYAALAVFARARVLRLASDGFLAAVVALAVAERLAG